jgi:uncharacterized protein YbcI
MVSLKQSQTSAEFPIIASTIEKIMIAEIRILLIQSIHFATPGL